MARDGWENHSYRKRAKMGFGGFLHKEPRRSENSFLSISRTRVLAEDSFDNFNMCNIISIFARCNMIETMSIWEIFDNLRIHPEDEVVEFMIFEKSFVFRVFIN